MRGGVNYKMDYNQSGVFEGVAWSVTYLGGREFRLQAGEQIENYTCSHPMIFGIDVSDKSEINKRLDEMQGI
jgi:hypothetical protein